MAMKKSDVSVWMSRDERLAYKRISTALRPIYTRVQNATVNRTAAIDPVRKAHYQLREDSGPAVKKLLAEREAVLLAAEHEMSAAFEQMDAMEQQLLADADFSHVAEHVISENRKKVLYKSSQGKYKPGHCDEYIEYRLKESMLIDAGSGNPVYYPEVVPAGHVSAEQLIREMAERLHMNDVTIRIVLDQLSQTVLAKLRTNHTLSLGDMFVVGASLKGTCVGEETAPRFRRTFQPGIMVRMMPLFQRKFRWGLGSRLTKAAPKRTDIVSIRAVVEPSADGVLAPGTLVQLNGLRLKYNTKAEDEGVFLYAAGSGEHRLLPVSIGKKGTDKTLFAALPKTIPQGVYSVQIRRRIRNSEKLCTTAIALIVTVGL